MDRKMLRLLLMAEAASVQSTKCIYSAHYTAVGFGLCFREKGVSSSYMSKKSFLNFFLDSKYFQC